MVSLFRHKAIIPHLWSTAVIIWIMKMQNQAKSLLMWTSPSFNSRRYYSLKLCRKYLPNCASSSLRWPASPPFVDSFTDFIFPFFPDVPEVLRPLPLWRNLMAIRLRTGWVACPAVAVPLEGSSSLPSSKSVHPKFSHTLKCRYDVFHLCDNLNLFSVSCIMHNWN